MACNHCPRCFCYNCYKQRHSYGIINWAKVVRETDFHCPVCTGKEPASNAGGELGTLDVLYRLRSWICASAGLFTGQVAVRSFLLMPLFAAQG